MLTFLWYMLLMVFVMAVISIITTILTVMVGFLAVVGPPVLFLVVIVFLVYLFSNQIDE